LVLKSRAGLAWGRSPPGAAFRWPIFGDDKAKRRLVITKNAAAKKQARCAVRILPGYKIKASGMLKNPNASRAMVRAMVELGRAGCPTGCCVRRYSGPSKRGQGAIWNARASHEGLRTVISAGMPKPRPWTVTIRLRKRLIWASVQREGLPSLDAGFRHPPVWRSDCDIFPSRKTKARKPL